MATVIDGTYYRACNLCEAICGLEIEISGGRIAHLRGDGADVLSHGHICPKGNALIDLYNDPDRLRKPLRRTGDSWVEMEWDEALDHVAGELAAIVTEHGADAIGIYTGNPAVHNSGTLLSAGGFLKAFATKNRFSATSVDQLPHHRAALDMFGHPMMLPIPDIDRTDYFLVMGANPLASNGSIMTAPGMRHRMAALRARGGRIVTIDPRKSETALASDEHHFIRPESDAFFLLALIATIFADGRADLGRLAPWTDGFETIAKAVAPYTPEAVAARTGIAAETIRRIAHDFAGAEAAVAYGRIGLSTQSFGGLCQWLVNVLNAITGNLDEPGGAMWTHPAFDLMAHAKPGEIHADRYRSRVRGMLEFNGEFPVATLVDEMTAPGAGQIRGFICIAGNPVLSTPDGTKLESALAKLDFMVAIDPYLNETTRHADVILPPATGLETDHYDVVFHHFAVRDTARYNDAIFAIDDDQRYDWQIFEGLRARLTGKTGKSPRERIEQALGEGPHRTSIAALRSAPHGLDYGALTRSLPERLLTADGRIRLAPAAYLADFERLERELPPPAGSLVLIGRRQLRSNNSWMHNAPRLMRGADRCTLLIHPRDAQARNIASGARVRVRSPFGEIEVCADVTDTIMPGVTSLPHGFGHTRAGVREAVAAATPGASINDLTDASRLDELTGNAALCGIAIEVCVV